MEVQILLCKQSKSYSLSWENDWILFCITNIEQMRYISLQVFFNLLGILGL